MQEYIGLVYRTGLLSQYSNKIQMQGPLIQHCIEWASYWRSLIQIFMYYHDNSLIRVNCMRPELVSLKVVDKLHKIL